MGKTSFGERVKMARDLRDWTLDEVGKRLGVALGKEFSPQRVGNWENSGKVPSLEIVGHLATILGVNHLWLAWGLGSIENEDGTFQSELVAERGRAVPLLESPNTVLERPQNVAEAAKVYTFFDCGPESYALRIKDVSNAPEFSIGDIIVIDPQEPHERGDMVLAVMGPNLEPVFRRYAVRSNPDGTKYTELQPLNPAWEADFIRSENDGRIIGTMTEHTKPRRRPSYPQL